MKADKDVVATVVFIVAVVLLVNLLFSWPFGRESCRPDPVFNDRSKLHQIAIACKMYASDYGGFYPPDFSYLFDGYFRNPRVLLAFGERDPDGDVADAMEWTSFVYFRGHTADSPPDAVLAFLPPGHHKDDLGLVAFVGNEAIAVPLREFTRVLNRHLLPVSGHGVEAVSEDEP